MLYQALRKNVSTKRDLFDHILNIFARRRVSSLLNFTTMIVHRIREIRWTHILLQNYASRAGLSIAEDMTVSEMIVYHE